MAAVESCRGYPLPYYLATRVGRRCVMEGAKANRTDASQLVASDPLFGQMGLVAANARSP